jgi:hypothetical protein
MSLVSSLASSLASRLPAPIAAFGRRTLGTALRELPRWRKARWQRRHRADGERAGLAFVFGTQRSGTTMLLEVLDRSRDSEVYHEYHSAAMDEFRLRPPSVIDGLVARSAARVIVLKPITESHRADWLLNRFPYARAIWVFRHYQDVANSAMAKWPGNNTEFVDRVREGNLQAMDWRGERVSEEVLATVRHLAEQPLSQAEGAVLFWYARNALYFEMDLASDPRVMLVKYDELVSHPARFAEIFRHVGIPFDPRSIEEVHASSVGRRPFGPIREDVREVCDAMMRRLETAALEQSSASQATKPD